MRTRIGVISRLLCLGGLALAGFSASGADGPPPSPVTVDSVVERDMTPRQWVSATVVSEQDAMIPSQIDGRVIWVAAVGTKVTPADVLARIDDTVIRIRIDEIQADVTRFGARIKFLEQEAARLEKLVKQNNTAQTRLEEIQADRDAVRAEQVAARARLRKAEFDLLHAQVKSPFDGVVVSRSVSAGNWVETGADVARVVNTSNLEVKALVPVSALEWITPGNSIPVVSARAGAEFMVRSLVAVGDPPSRLLELRLVAKNANLIVGEAVRVAVPIAASQRSLALSRDALVLRRDGAAVFRVLSDESVERVSVTVGIGEGPLVAVTGELSPGDAVVVRGNERLRPGQKVTTLNGAK